MLITNYNLSSSSTLNSWSFFAGEIIDTYSNGSNVLKKKNEVQDCTIDLKYYFIGAGYVLFNY